MKKLKIHVLVPYKDQVSRKLLFIFIEILPLINPEFQDTFRTYSVYTIQIGRVKWAKDSSGSFLCAEIKI